MRNRRGKCYCILKIFRLIHTRRNRKNHIFFHFEKFGIHDSVRKPDVSMAPKSFQLTLSSRFSIFWMDSQTRCSTYFKISTLLRNTTWFSKTIFMWKFHSSEWMRRFFRCEKSSSHFFLYSRWSLEERKGKSSRRKFSDQRHRLQTTKYKNHNFWREFNEKWEKKREI